MAAVLFGTAGTAQALGPDAATPLGRRRRTHRRRYDRALARDCTRRPVARGGRAAVRTPLATHARRRRGRGDLHTCVPGGGRPYGRRRRHRRRHRGRPLLRRRHGVGVAFGSPEPRVVPGHRRDGCRWCSLLVASAESSSTDAVDGIGLLLALAAGAGYALYSVTAKSTMSAGVPPTLALAATVHGGRDRGGTTRRTRTVRMDRHR